MDYKEIIALVALALILFKLHSRRVNHIKKELNIVNEAFIGLKRDVNLRDRLAQPDDERIRRLRKEAKERFGHRDH